MHVNANGRGQQDYKMIVVGHRGVGKSALVVRFLTNRFISEYQENSEMTCDGMVEVDGEKMPLRIQDTSERGIRLPAIDHYFRAADAIMLVYSVTDRMSFQRLRNTTARLKQKLKEHEFSDDKLDKIPVLVIIGNKGDLDHSREVKTQEGLKLAEDLDCHFYETSASEGWSKQFSRKRAESVGVKTVNTVPSQRPSTLWTEKTSAVRRKSDPALLINSIFNPKVINSPENDVNNNDSKQFLTIPPSNVPQISISPSAEPSTADRIPSRGRRFIQKLSPRLSRKFGGPKQQNAPKMSNISAGLARLGAPGLVVGAVGRGSSTVMPNKNNSNATLRPVASHRVAVPPPKIITSRQREQQRTHTLRADGSWSSSFSDASSSSSSESLLTTNEGDIRHALFFRAETPVSDGNMSSSEDEDFITISKSAEVATLSRLERRSRVARRNLENQTVRARCNSDVDSKIKLHVSVPKRNKSETRLNSVLTEPNLSNASVKSHADYKEKKCNVSEPFKHLCRDARSARRMRDKLTPTRIFRDGIRKIKTSLVSDQSHNNYHFKNPHFQVTAVSP